MGKKCPLLLNFFPSCEIPINTLGIIRALSGHYPPGYLGAGTPRRPGFLGAGTPGRLRVCAACVLLASHRHDAPRMYAGALARLVRRGNSKNMGSRAASPTHGHTPLRKDVNRTFLHRILESTSFTLRCFAMTCAINPTSKIVTSTFFRTDRKNDLQTFQSYTFLHSFPSVLDNDVHVFIFDKICTAPPGSPRPPLSDKIAKNFLGKLQKIVPKI